MSGVPEEQEGDCVECNVFAKGICLKEFKVCARGQVPAMVHQVWIKADMGMYCITTVRSALWLPVLTDPCMYSVGNVAGAALHPKTMLASSGKVLVCGLSKVCKVVAFELAGGSPLLCLCSCRSLTHALNRRRLQARTKLGACTR